MYEQPYLVHFPRIGDSMLGYISVLEKDTLPFDVKRVYWTYFTPESLQRGGHAHYELVQILIAVAGQIIVETEMPGGKKERFVLSSPDLGILIPRLCWRTMQYTHNAVQMCIASKAYDEKDYIRDYEEFKKIT